MQPLLCGTILVAAFAVITVAEHLHRDLEEQSHLKPVYKNSYGVQGYDNYLLDNGALYENEEYEVRAKPVQLYVTYTRQGRGKKKGNVGYGWGKGGWWYYRDHKGCHAGTFGPPPGPGLEYEHYVRGACGALGNHFKRVQGHGSHSHRNVGHGWGRPNHGWGQSNYGGGYGHGRPHYKGLEGGYRRGVIRGRGFQYGNAYRYGF